MEKIQRKAGVAVRGRFNRGSCSKLRALQNQIREGGQRNFLLSAGTRLILAWGGMASSPRNDTVLRCLFRGCSRDKSPKSPFLVANFQPVHFTATTVHFPLFSFGRRGTAVL